MDILEVNGVKVGLTGIYELAEHLDKQEEVRTNIAALKEAGAQVIIVNFHWGIEKEYLPNDTQKTLAHLAIDEGADLVIGLPTVCSLTSAAGFARGAIALLDSLQVVDTFASAASWGT